MGVQKKFQKGQNLFQGGGIQEVEILQYMSHMVLYCVNYLLRCRCTPVYTANKDVSHQ